MALSPAERGELERTRKRFERGILDVDGVASQLNGRISPENLESLFAEIPPAWAEAVKEHARQRPGGYYRLHGMLPDDIPSRLAECHRMTLYLLDQPCGPENDGDCRRFHGHRILFERLLTDPRDIAEVAEAIRAANDQGTRGNRCFIPHHGVRAESAAVIFDLVICFLCENMQVYRSPEVDSFRWADLSERPRALFARLLNAP